MRPVPVAFHIGPLEVHTYGIGLALTFWFGYRYLARRLRDNGYPSAWLGSTFVWIVVTAILGARIVHVVANVGYYSQHPIEIGAIWHGGLSSFGGLVLAIPTAILSARRRCPQLRVGPFADLAAPVLVASWALGRLLGPQLMIAGGGRPTSSWIGMYYAGEVGKRLPVPLFQAAECAAVYLVALAVERRVAGRIGLVGVVAATAAGLWGLTRFFDEYLWLPYDNGTDAVEAAGLAMLGAGGAVVAVLGWRARSSRTHGTPRPRLDSEIAPLGGER